MTQVKRKFFSSFASLNLTQFFTAFNDNLYKLLLIFFLISIKGERESNTILATAGAIFVIPFIAFASLAGTLADRFSKRSIIYFTRFMEILTMLFGVAVFFFQSTIGGYCVLFLMATHSALFSPSKFGIIPEIVSKERISNCNGILTATTYLAIILGTFFASFVTEVTHKNFVSAGLFCVIVSMLGLVSSLGIQKTYPQAEKKKVSLRFISKIIQTLDRARQTRYLLITLIFGSYFLFIGAYTQLNIIPFALQSLNLSDVHGGYLFLMTALGIGLGSFCAGKISGKEVEIGFIPLASFGITICFMLLYFFQHSFFVVVPILIGVGFFGGFYIVPIDAFIQLASPDENRGENLATANFLSFLGVILASGFLALLGNVFSLSAARGFFIIGIITFFIGIFLFLLCADQVVRLLVAKCALTMGRVQVVGRKKIRAQVPQLLVAPRISWLDTLIVMAILPRMVRYIVPIRPKRRPRTFLYYWLRLIPVDIHHFSPMGEPALEAIRGELDKGQTVCLMQPVMLPSGSLAEWTERLKGLLNDIPVEIIPIHIHKGPCPTRGNRLYQLWSLLQAPIKVSYGDFRSKQNNV